TRGCRTAKADLIPGCRVRVVGRDDVMQKTFGKKHLRRHVTPGRVMSLSLLHRPQQIVLIQGLELVEPNPVSSLTLRVQRPKGAAPRRRCGRQPRITV